MMKFLRSQSQTVLIMVLGVIGLGFFFYGSSGNLLNSTSGHISNDYGRIDGTDLSVADLYDAVHDTRNAFILEGRSQQISQTGGPAAVAEEAWRQLLLMHEADRLHIQISNQEVVDAIQKEPLFQQNGVFSPDLYQSRMVELQNMLHIPADSGSDPQASTKTAFETFVRNTIRASAVRDTLLSTVHSPIGDVSGQYEKAEGPVEVSLITFDPKNYVNQVQVSSEDIATEYKDHPEKPAYRSPEKRKVDYVLLQLTPDQAKLPDAEKAAAKETLGEKALALAIALQPDPTPGAPSPDFVTEAKKRGFTPETTDFFTADTPPANVPPSPAFNNAAFALSNDNPVSKVVDMDNGVAVLQLVEIQPSELLPLDQIQAQITQPLRESKSIQAAEDAAQKADEQIRALLDKGGNFKTIAAGMNLKIETLPVFVPMDVLQSDHPNPRLQTIADAVATLNQGQVSNVVPVETDNTRLLIHVDSRTKADPAGLAGFENRIRSSQDEQILAQVYVDWANWKSRQPGTHKPPELDLYGSVE
jgi:peptidyl-prolyl cis-trans isomerase D